MNSDEYQQLIVRRAVKAANKERTRTGRNLDLDGIRDLKVVTANPFSRIFIGLVGAILLGSMIYLQIAEGFYWLFTVCAFIGLFLLVVAIRGRRKRISEIENAMDLLDIGGNLVGAIIENIAFSVDL